MRTIENTASPFSTSKRKLATSLLGVATGMLMSGSAFAIDVTRANIKEMSFTTQHVYNQWINVVSSDNTRWDKIEPGSVSFGAHVMIDTREYVFYRGYVDTVGIILGPCGGTACMGKPLLWAASPNTKDYENQMAVTFPTSKIPVSSTTGIATVHHGDDIIARCNEGTPGQEHTFDYLMQATFIADTYTAAVSGYDASGAGGDSLPPQWINGTDHSLTKSFAVQVRCKPFEPAVSMSQPDPNPDPHRTKITATGIDLFLSTFVTPASAQHGPSGTQCKPLKVTTRVETDKAGPVNVKRWRQVNGGPITSDSKQMDATALGGDKFGDDWVKFEHFTETTTIQYKAEVLGGSFAPSTPWKSITIHCNGDFASPQTNANPDNGNPPRGKPQNEARVPTLVTPPPRVTLPPRVTSPPRIVCVGGKVRAGACACPPSLSPMQKGRASFHCVKIARLPDRRMESQATMPMMMMPRRPFFHAQPGPGSRPRPMIRPPMRHGFR